MTKKGPIDTGAPLHRWKGVGDRYRDRAGPHRRGRGGFRQLETIRDLGIHCVPVNFLNPRPGTPMADVKAITPGECLAAQAVFRLMMPTAHRFVMGGREVNLGGLQHRILEAGADGTMVGNYLTSAGGTPREVAGQVKEQGMTLRPPATAAGASPARPTARSTGTSGPPRPARRAACRCSAS